VLVYELLASGPSKIMEAASARAREAGYVLDIVSLDASNDAGITDAIDLVAQSHIAGVLAFTPNEHVISALRAANFSVPISLEAESEDWSSGGTHLGEAGVDLMVEHLASLGHKRFFHIGGPVDSLAARGRARAYTSAIDRLGLLSVGSLPGDWSALSGHEAALELPLDAGVTALVAANDQTALGAIAALRLRGVSVPGDLSVVGFDDIPESQFFQPALTTVRFDFASQGRNMVDRLIARIEGRKTAGGPAVDEPTAIIRESTALPRR
jgi:LacI family transcriptional regulator